jgi:hypothetical protein
MKRLTIFLISFLLSANVFAQLQYKNIESIRQNDTLIFTTGKQTLKILTSKDAGGLSNITIIGKNILNYRSADEGTQFSFALFYNEKLAEGFLFVHKQLEYSRGCEIFHLSKNAISNAGELPVAAYTKDGKTMNYNSILPYLFIIKAFDRILINFETTFLVLNPSQSKEKIIKSNEIYYTFSNGKIQMQNH